MSSGPLEFRVPIGALVPTRVLDANRVDGAVVVLIEVGQEEWEMIDLVMYFNLDWNCRHPGEIVGDGIVRILMQLDPALVDRVVSDDVYAELAALPVDDELRSTKNWYALEVTEAVELPPSLADKGEVRQGFTTTWRAELATR
ncbi:MAG: hypothetical protein WBP59_16800 [Ilumatobacteraceae bacterium]